jgi:hypothetical protein
MLLMQLMSCIMLTILRRHDTYSHLFNPSKVMGDRLITLALRADPIHHISRLLAQC